jgi:quinol monooxygenase YgiN
MADLRLMKGLVPGGAVAMTVLLAGNAPAQDKPHPIAVMVKGTLKDPDAPFTLLVRFQAKEGAGEKLEAAFAKAAKATRQEKGCLVYQLNRDVKMPTHYVIYERWQNLAALEAHLKSPHITTLLTEINEIRATPPEAQVLVPVAD